MLLRRAIRRFSQVSILHSQTDNIYFNLATQEMLYEDALKHPTLFLWRNDRTIVIGRHQNPWKQCHLKAMEDDHVCLSRRITGGGAVYHDLGNTCFSFLTPYQIAQPLDYKSVNNTILLAALSDLGVKAQAIGRNDILCNNKKISGSAYKLNLGNIKTGQGRKALHHGTILRCVDTGALKKYLNPNKAKLESKGISSVIARVMNLNDEFPNFTHEFFCSALERRFIEHYKATTIQKKLLTYDSLRSHPKIAKRFEELKSWQWLYGSSPEFKNNIETRFPWGTIDMFFDVEDGIIKKARIYSDSINVQLVAQLNEILSSGRIPYDFKGIQSLRHHLLNKLTDQQSKSQVNQLCDWMKSEF